MGHLLFLWVSADVAGGEAVDDEVTTAGAAVETSFMPPLVLCAPGNHTNTKWLHWICFRTNIPKCVLATSSQVICERH